MKNKLIMALISLVIAFGLWMYVITVVSPGSEASFNDVPVVFQSENALADRGLIITAYKNTSVDLRLAGNRSDLNKLNRSNITVTADVSKIYEAGIHSLNYSVTYPGDIANNAITVQSRDPGTVTITVEEKLSKFVDVEVEFVGTVPENVLCETESAVLDHTSISVTGPKSVIDQLAKAKITVNLNGQTQSINQDYPFTLYDANGNVLDTTWLTTNVDAVHLTLEIRHWKNIPVKVNVTYGGGATKENCQITQSIREILISGSLNQLENLNELVLDNINLSDVEDDEIRSYKIELPEGIENETGIWDVTVEIKFNGLAKREFQITEFAAVNVPAGMTVVFPNQSKAVTLRGPQAQLDAIDPENVILEVDFSSVQPGTNKVPATVTIKNQSGEVGAVGTYSVMAELKEADAGDQ